MNILVCPLDWGLGHATRCVPIIRELQAQGCEVLIGGSGRALAFLKAEFPDCQFLHIPSYPFFYSKSIPLSAAMAFSAPAIIFGILRENRQLRNIIRTHNIHAVISDNRFGLWSSKIPCVYITHQVRIKAGAWLKFLEPLLYCIHSFFIRKFNRLWIPDYENEPNLSGELGHHFGNDLNAEYLGPLSRFNNLEYSGENQNELRPADILFIVSGPEPQRSIFEDLIIRQANTTDKKMILLQGIPGPVTQPSIQGNLTIFPHLSSADMKFLIDNAEIIVCRPGYSTVMDLAVMQKKAFFIPTPGQTEQEYLAAYYAEQGIAAFSPQHLFNLKEIASLAQESSGFREISSGCRPEPAIRKLVDYLCTLKNVQQLTTVNP